MIMIQCQLGSKLEDECFVCLFVFYEFTSYDMKNEEHWFSFIIIFCSSNKDNVTGISKPNVLVQLAIYHLSLLSPLEITKNETLFGLLG